MSSTDIPDRKRGSERLAHKKRACRGPTVPEHAHPHTRLLYSILRDRAQRGVGITLEDLEAISGVRRATLKAWRRRSTPSLQNLTATLNVLGWRYIATPAERDGLPPELAAELAALAERFALEVPTTWALLLDIAAQNRARLRSQPEPRP